MIVGGTVVHQDVILDGIGERLGDDKLTVGGHAKHHVSAVTHIDEHTLGRSLRSDESVLQGIGGGCVLRDGHALDVAVGDTRHNALPNACHKVPVAGILARNQLARGVRAGVVNGEGGIAEDGNTEDFLNDFLIQHGTKHVGNKFIGSEVVTVDAFVTHVLHNGADDVVGTNLLVDAEARDFPNLLAGGDFGCAIFGAAALHGHHHFGHGMDERNALAIADTKIDVEDLVQLTGLDDLKEDEFGEVAYRLIVGGKR